jgi:hypothetical protein
LDLYVGVHDGTNGWSTSIQQQIAFYNKLRMQFHINDTAAVINQIEMDHWIQQRAAFKQYNCDSIGDRACLAHKFFEKVTFHLFEGGHEIRYKEVVKQLNLIESL